MPNLLRISPMKKFVTLAILFSMSTLMLVAQTDSSRYDVVHLGKNINTNGAEYGGLILDDSILLYSAIHNLGDTKGLMIDFDHRTMQIYQAPISQYGKIGKGKFSSIGFNSSSYHSGNLAYDANTDVIFFTRCQGNDVVTCEIYYCTRDNGKWSKVKKMKGDINLKGYTSTQPAVGHTVDGSTILYFSSDRPNGVGGLDIWYSIIDDVENPTPAINLGTPVNTPYDEKTPFYDDQDGYLYFSSDREESIGGQDIFYSAGSRNSWHTPVQMPQPINTKYNDIYFCINSNDHEQGFLSSNREDSYFLYDSACCNDLYRWTRQTPILIDTSLLSELHTTRLQDGTVTRVLTLPAARKAKDLLPINLYFHNDEPDPKSRKPITNQTYFQTYNTYMFMKNKYIDEQPPVCHGDIEQFFDNEVHGNCKNFEQFLKYLSDDLKSGRSVSITIAGHASTILNNEYNFNLSKRRIASIINQILAYNEGQTLPNKGIRNIGALHIKEVPYGSSQAVSAPYGSIYSIAAASERRIEIMDYIYTDEDTINHSRLILPAQVQNIGTFELGRGCDVEIRLPNSVKTNADLDYISAVDEHATITGHSRLIPGKDLVVYIHLDNRNAKKEETRYLPLSLRLAGETITQTIFLEYNLISPYK